MAQACQHKEYHLDLIINHHYSLLEFDEYGALRKCSYFINNLYHRLDGPAIEWYENDRLIDCSYYINGKKIKDEFVIAIIDVSRDDE